VCAMSERTRKMDTRRQNGERTRGQARTSSGFNRRNEPIFKVVSKAATDLNDVLNAVALRSALMCGRPADSRTDSDNWRLAGLLERASELVRELQTYVQEIESEPAPDEPPAKDHPRSQ
jgi:uncharacterized alpha-E superfamily protein